MIPASIQLRLQLWHGILLTLVLISFGTLASRLAWSEEERRWDDLLAARLDLILHAPEGRVPPPPPPRRPDPAPIRAEVGRNIWELERRYPDSYFMFLDHDGTVFARSSNAPPAVPFPGPQRVDRRKGEVPQLIPGPRTVAPEWRSRGLYREAYRVLPLGDAILAGRDMEPEWNAFLKRMGLFSLAGLVLLGCGLAGGWWLTREALKPIASMTSAAQRIAAGDWNQRIDTGTAAGELSELGGVLNHTFNQLQASFEKQARFTSDASHELRTPLSVILSKTQTALTRERSTAEYQEALRVCQRAATRMRALTEKLLQLSREDSGDLQTGQEPVDLAEITAQALELAGQPGLEKHLEPAIVHGDGIRLGQVVANLVENAFRYGGPGGPVRVQVARVGENAILQVRDAGPGIAAEHLPRIFDRFYRADSSRTAGGSGLGLSIARWIVEAHGGSIQAENAPEGGAIFTVTLPAAA